MKKLFLAFALLCVSLFAETVKVGMDKEYPPFSYLNNGVMAGFEVDLLKEIASQTGITIEFVPMVFDDIFNEVESGHIDVGCGAIDITPERQERFDFSIPYNRTADIYVTEATNKNLIGPSDLKGKKIGVLTAGSKQEKVARSIPDAKVIINASLANLLISVKTGRIDACIIESINAPAVLGNGYEFASSSDKMAMDTLKSFGMDSKLEIFYIDTASAMQQGMIVKKGTRSDLLNKINSAIDNLKQSGKINSMLAKYGLK